MIRWREGAIFSVFTLLLSIFLISAIFYPSLLFPSILFVCSVFQFLLVLFLFFSFFSLSGYCRFSGIKGGNASGGLGEEERGGIKKDGAMICGFRISKNRMNGKKLIIIIDSTRCYSKSLGVNEVRGKLFWINQISGGA